MNITSNNPACVDLYNSTLRSCEEISGRLGTGEEAAALAATVLGIELIFAGGGQTLEGLVRNTVNIKELALKYLSRKVNDEAELRINEDFLQQSAPLQSNPALWKKTFAGLRVLTGGVLLGTLGIISLTSGHALSQNSHHLEENCPPLAEKALGVCNWANDYAVAIINQVIKQHFGV